jgi:hypothetical protein
MLSLIPLILILKYIFVGSKIMLFKMLNFVLKRALIIPERIAHSGSQEVFSFAGAMKASSTYLNNTIRR